MGCLNIEDRHGHQIILSDDPNSPAAPYIREYQPRNLQDLQEIGVIHKSVNLDQLKQARDDTLGEQAKTHVHLVPPLMAHADRYPDAQYYAKAYNAGRVRQTAVETMSAILSTRYDYHPREANLLAKKALALEISLQGKAFQPIWRQIELAEDLLIHTPVLVSRTINSILARDVVIYRSGTLIAEGSYLLISCRNLSGGSLYWDPLKKILNTNNHIFSL